MPTLRGGTRPSGETSCVLPPLPTSQLVMTVQPTRMRSKMLEILYPKLCHILLHTNVCQWLSLVSQSPRIPSIALKYRNSTKNTLNLCLWIGNWRCISRSHTSAFTHIMCKCLYASTCWKVRIILNDISVPQDVNPLSDEEALLFCNTESSLQKEIL